MSSSKGTGHGVDRVAPYVPDARWKVPVLRLSPLMSYKTESGSVHTCKKGGSVGRLGAEPQESTSGGRNTQSQLKRSRVPYVRLERLRARAMPTPQPLHGQTQSGPVPDPRPAGGALIPEQAEVSTAEDPLLKGGSAVDMVMMEDTGQSGAKPWEQLLASSPCHTMQCGQDRAGQGGQEGPENQGGHGASVLTPAPRSNTESDPGPESDTRPDMESEPELESEPGFISEPDLETRQTPELCLIVESRQQPEEQSEGRVNSEQNVDTEGELQSGMELAQQVEPESGPDTVSGLQAEVQLSVESQPDPAEAAAEPPATSEPGDRPEVERSPAGQQAEMENEDFCGVCLNGGDLLCCDRCPKVFHLSCHVPPLLSFPTGDWVCALCRDVQQPEVEYDCENTRLSASSKAVGEQRGLSECDLRKCEKLTLCISCNILSAPFHEPVSPLARHYYQIIKKPMDLSVIRKKLTRNGPQHYYTPEEFVADIFLMFRNCAKFNYPDSEVAQAGRSLEAFFSSKLREVYPNKMFPVLDDDSDSDDYEEVQRAGVPGFSWPNEKEHSHRKRKRRHSLNWRRHHF